MLKTILDFIYSGQIDINEENVGDIVAAASSMELIALEERCGKFWAVDLKVENCVEIYLNADKYRLSDLHTKALKFVCNHFEAVPIDDIQQLDEKNLLDVLKYDEITAPETIIFNRLSQWMNQNKVEADEFASNMLDAIRLNHIPYPVSCRVHHIQN